ncbi:UDP-glucose 4-epimerase GalE [Citrobacter sp. 50677481]|uniref:UDP-glucose 4-epimerase GalE n=1 Tax=Citrobacter sp. 50677481 TaxID=1736699 RepID=UPI0007423972|nr:UDP-glucose 4-epimerase GalE [Citrobacter sp. 50677481]KSY30960.1 UDP-glucose 4-epimerase [Citrobacter sp. 50677481]HCQ7757188.1 UDP-glucose 4-epimerase GalE [Citrobacter sedlakii]
MSILVTGGAGYIGSHTVVRLLEKGKSVVIIDDFNNSSPEALIRVKDITNVKSTFYEGSILDKHLLKRIFSENNITDVIHFAGLKSVGESISYPLKYYEVNISGTLCLIDEMIKQNVNNLIFSSSATVYGEPETIPLTESSRIGGTTNPYGTSKLMVEKILEDIARAYPDFRVTILRYFNPVAAHPSGNIGEDPNGIPNNLMPYICQVAVGKHKQVSVYGSDYPTKDGTGVRDFIHVMDLAEGHIAALDHRNEGPNHKVYNLGTGKGYSVLELLTAFERVTSRTVPYTLSERRSGDIAECWSDPAKAEKELGWKARRGLDDMIRDSWNWQQKNPNGYKKD